MPVRECRFRLKHLLGFQSCATHSAAATKFADQLAAEMMSWHAESGTHTIEAIFVSDLVDM